MIYPSLGVPGRFSEACENLARTLAAQSDGGADFIHADTTHELGSAMLACGQRGVVMVSRRPSTELIKSLIQNKRPFIISLEAYEQSVSALINDHGVSLLDAVRQAASAGAALVPLLRLENGLVLRERLNSNTALTAKAISQHFGFSAHSDVLALTEPTHSYQDLAKPIYHTTSNISPALFETDLDELLPDLISGALSPIWHALEGADLGEVLWHRDLFLTANTDGAEPVPAVIDVTGSARCLIYGPYIHLPPGSWSCSLTMGFSSQSVGLKLVAEIATNTVLNKITFDVSEPGFFEIEFSCVIPDADYPVEIRIFNSQAAFEGHVALIQARMKPLKAVRIPVTAV
jgi:hypothetical protein